ncbi:hypothetical protein UlMin_022049 [Ulmus minor]
MVNAGYGGGSSSSSSPAAEEKFIGSPPVSTGALTKDDDLEEAIKVVKVKEEAIEVFDDEIEDRDFGDDCGRGSCSSSSSLVLPKPMEGLHENGPPPFLNKTYQMVDDPDTDSIVSWSEARDSFVVWDDHEFSKNLIPKYFKHSNFSSFIRQLNTYGFKKVDPDRWEFANEGFQGGKKHLMKNIKRRSKYNKQSNGKLASCDLKKAGMEDQIDSLKEDQNTLKLEILKLKQEDEDSRSQLTAVEERIRFAESNQHQMLLFLAKTAINPAFLKQMIQRRRQKREISGVETGKRRRLLPNPDAENLVNAIETIQSVDYRMQIREEQVTMEYILTGNMPEKSTSTHQKQTPFLTAIAGETLSSLGAEEMSGTTGPTDVSSAYHAMSENLFEEISVVDEAISVNDSKFYHELEDLIEKPSEWGGYMTTLM